MIESSGVEFVCDRLCFSRDTLDGSVRFSICIIVCKLKILQTIDLLGLLPLLVRVFLCTFFAISAVFPLERTALSKKKMYDDLVFSIGNVHFSSIKLIAIENCVRIMRPLWMNESPFDSDTSYVTSISGELQAADYFPERISR